MIRTLLRPSNKVVVAMSGGVDSSVTAYLLQQQHSKVVGLFMNNWNTQDEDDNSTTCTQSEQDLRDVQAICSQLGKIPLYQTSFAAEYWTHVFEPFLQGIGPTQMPNPDMLCNRHIKFGKMKDYCFQQLKDVQAVATGHYARLWRRKKESWMESGITDTIIPCQSELSQIKALNIESCDMPYYVYQSLSNQELEWIHNWGDNQSPLLLVGEDSTKDQSYFLSMTPGSAFHNVLFPLGYLSKQSPPKQSIISVRDIAKLANLATAHKRDSTGICFVGRRPRGFSNFVSQYLDLQAMENFVDVETGKVVGSTSPSQLYTIGQGAKISGASSKWFVVDRKDNDIIVSQGTNHPSLYCTCLYVREFSWTASTPPTPLLKLGHLRAKCRIRHLQPLVDCQVKIIGHEYSVVFDRPLRGVTKGQIIALYLGVVCLGGGIISRRGPTLFEQGITNTQKLDLHPAGANDSSVFVPE